ncbi:MAG: AMP-binding protein [Geodermatophilaceae bacterium]
MDDRSGADRAANNLSELVSRAADRRADGVAFVSGATRVTWAQFEAAVSTLSAALVGEGLVPGDRLALMLRNTLDFPLHYFAALRAGWSSYRSTPPSPHPRSTTSSPTPERASW